LIEAARRIGADEGKTAPRDNPAMIAAVGICEGSAAMASIPEGLTSELTLGFVLRTRIADTLGIKTGISTSLITQASRMVPAHVVLRKNTGEHSKVEYHLRPAGKGEDSKNIIEV
jgi:hypothetical protein